MRPVITRFAPSPTGYLHIGGLRTALFSWAFARQQQGQFLLRIEDTDSARSLTQHSQAIIDAMQWAKMSPDIPPVFQSANRARHQAVIKQLLEQGKAYRCYTSPDELDQLRQAQTLRGEKPVYDRQWRDSTATPPAGVSPCIRLKLPLDGQTRFQDAIKGTLSIANTELDDFIIARSDGSPTYNFAAACDDIDMKISHIIRGDDHVMNTYRQWHVFNALLAQNGQDMPIFAHLPMILSAINTDTNTDTDTTPIKYERMSKRNAAVDVDIYRKNGIIPEALINYLARLSWAHGDVEIFDSNFLIEQFNFNSISQSPARFDNDKLNWVNREHLHTLSQAQLHSAIDAAIEKEIKDIKRSEYAHLQQWDDISDKNNSDIKEINNIIEQLNALLIDNSPQTIIDSITALINLFKMYRLKNDDILQLIRPRLNQLHDITHEIHYFYHTPTIDRNELNQYLNADNRAAFDYLVQQLQELQQWDAASIKNCIKTVVKKFELKFQHLGMPIRLLLTGRSDSPDISNIAMLLGQKTTIARLQL